MKKLCLYLDGALPSKKEMIGPLYFVLYSNLSTSVLLYTSGGDGVVTIGGFLQLPSVNFPTPRSMLPKKM